MRTLTELGPHLGFAVTIIPEVTVGGRDVNSTRIRELLGEGHVAEAAALLGAALRGARQGDRGRPARPHARLPDRESRPRERGAPGAGRLRRRGSGSSRPAAAGRAAGGHQRRQAPYLQGRCGAARGGPPHRLDRRSLRAARRALASSSGCARSGASRTSTRCARRSRPTATRRAIGWRPDERARAVRARPSSGASSRRASSWPRGHGGGALVRAARRRLPRGVALDPRAPACCRCSALSVPAHLLEHLAARAALAPSHRARRRRSARPLFAAQAVGFMANNVFPLRIGEVVRAWYLARESGALRAAIFGTVIARARDRRDRRARPRRARARPRRREGRRPRDAHGALPARWRSRSRRWPSSGCSRLSRAVIELGARVWTRVLPETASERLASGLAPARRGAPRPARRRAARLGRVLLAPDLARDRRDPVRGHALALDIDLGSPRPHAPRLLRHPLWVGVAVAMPSAPGFFGPYHAACGSRSPPSGCRRRWRSRSARSRTRSSGSRPPLTGLAVVRRPLKTPLPDLAEVAPE